jgi:hypothetical protein
VDPRPRGKSSLEIRPRKEGSFRYTFFKLLFFPQLTYVLAFVVRIFF